MLLNIKFYIFTFLILALYGTHLQCSANLFSDMQKGVLQLLGDKEETPEHNMKIIEDYAVQLLQRDDQIEQLSSVLDEIDIKLGKLKARAKKCFPLLNSCLPFGNSSGIHLIHAPGFDEPFEVLCNSDLAGPGWLVIQQRINGKENFNRNFANYSQGFGSLSGDFFLGLEKIHRLTSSQRHQLYIYFENNYSHIGELYDGFKIGSKNQQYKLLSLGENLDKLPFDSLRSLEFMRFHTIDRDNQFKCAERYSGGWWFNDCGSCNLNAQYKDKLRGLKCDRRNHRKNIKMLIRPKN